MVSYAEIDEDARAVRAKAVGSLVGFAILCFILYYLIVGFGASVSDEEFASLQDGMTYQQATTIIGGDGDLVMDMNTMGMAMQTYRWRSADSGSVMLTFQDGLLSGKTRIP